MATRLPQPGADDGTWGDILNAFLEVSHDSAGHLLTGAIAAAGGVTSVNSKTPANGTVTLAPSDISGLGTAATQDSSAFDAAGAAAGAQAASLQKASNLSDLADVSAARTNLGLSAGATMNTTAGGDLSGTLPNPTVAKVNGVSVSGTPSSGQVLTATSSTAAGWSAPVTGFSDPTTTKGDLLVRGSSTTRLPVGSDGQVLTADSNQALGVTWGNPGQGGSFTAVAKTADYTAANYDFVLGDATAASFTVTLPAASNGACVRVKKLDSSTNAIVVAGQSASTIDGVSSQVVNNQYQCQDYMSDGTNWYQV